MSNDNASQEQQLNVSAQDILAALAFEAQRLVAAAQQHAAGYPFPPPAQMQDVIDRMAHLNRILLANYTSTQAQAETSLNAKSSMEVKLN